MARRRKPPELPGDALRHVLQRIDPERRLELFRIWASEVGDAVAAHAEPAALRDGVLSVRVQGAAWMQELQFAKDEIRRRLNARLGAEVIRDVYFVSGGGGARPAPPKPRTVDAAAADANDVDPATDLPPMRDARLAEVFARIARAHQRRGRHE